MVIFVLFNTFPADSNTIASMLFSNTSPSNVTVAPLPVIICPSWNTAVPSFVMVTFTPSNMNTVLSSKSPDTVKSELLNIVFNTPYSSKYCE